MKTDLRQLRHRLLLEQLSNIDNTDAHDLMSSVNRELAMPFRIKANGTLVVDIGPSNMVSDYHDNNRVPAPIGDVVPDFAGGSLTLPVSGSGTINVSSGPSINLAMGADQFAKVTISVDVNNDIQLIAGTPAASLALAKLPPAKVGTWTAGYIVIATDSSGDMLPVYEGDVYRYPTIEKTAPTMRLQLTDDKTSNYTVKTTDMVVMTDPTGNPVVVSLPSASLVGRGHVVVVTDISGIASLQGHEIDIVADGTDIINGEQTFRFTADYESRWLVSDGVSKWLIM